REKPKIRNRPRNVEQPGEMDRFPAVDRLEPCQFIEIFLDEIGEIEEKLRSLCGRCSRPGRKCGAGGLHRSINVARIAVRNLGDHFLGRWIDVVEMRFRLDEL